MDKSEFEKRLLNGIGDTDMWRLRRRTAVTAGRAMKKAGQTLSLFTAIRAENRKHITSMSILMDMTGELISASAKLLASDQHYAGAALLRQIVEIEYLTWTFKEGYRNPEKWLESTHEERMREFTPAKLRNTSKGRFLARDYGHHCEQGGHPVPRGAILLGDQGQGPAQLLLADLLVHSWRTWDQIIAWSEKTPGTSQVIAARSSKAYADFKKWGAADPLYVLMVEQYPDAKKIP